MLAPAGVLPSNALVNLTYWDQKQFTTSTTAGLLNPTAQIYRLTGLFDPDVTGTGHQPYFYDQWCTFYDRYRVISATWTVTAYQDLGGSDTTRYLTAKMYSSNESIGALDETIEALENKSFKKKLMYDRDANGGRPPTITLSGKVNSQAFHPSQNVGSLGALCSANPATMVNLGIGYGNANGSGTATATGMIVMVRIKFRVMFSEPKVVGKS